MKKNDLFIDVSSHNGYDITGILEDMGTQNTIIKVSESTNYLNPCLSAQVEQSNPVGFYHFAWFGGDVAEAEREARYFLDNVFNTDTPAPYNDNAESTRTNYRYRLEYATFTKH